MTEVADLGWLSVVPPVVAIALAIGTRQVFLSLGLFVWLGWTFLSAGDPLVGLIRGVDTYVAQIAQPDNARILLFSVLIGGVITLTQASGGMLGFVRAVERVGLVASRRAVGMLTVAVSLSVFLESNFGLLVSGSVAGLPSPPFESKSSQPSGGRGSRPSMTSLICSRPMVS